jgi:hypothetical protein
MLNFIFSNLQSFLPFEKDISGLFVETIRPRFCEFRLSGEVSARKKILLIRRIVMKWKTLIVERSE